MGFHAEIARLRAENERLSTHHQEIVALAEQARNIRDDRIAELERELAEAKKERASYGDIVTRKIGTLESINAEIWAALTPEKRHELNLKWKKEL